MTSFRLIVLIGVLLCPNSAFAQFAVGQPVDERGASFRMDHFDPLEYGAHPQNWSFAQGKDGKIYVANGTGVLVFDGERWIRIETPGHDVARSLAVDSSGTVYVGTVGNFGVIGVDSVGRGTYQSISEGQNLGVFRDIWRIYPRRSSVIFMASEGAIVWNGTRIHRIDAPTVFHTSFEVADRLFVNDLGSGLMELRGDSLSPAPNGAWFRGKKIYSFLMLESNVALVNVRNEGTYRYSLATGDMEVHHSPADDFLTQYPVYHSIFLDDGNIAYATLGGGTIIASPQGSIVDHLYRGNGFIDDVVNHLFQDQEGSLWIALNNKGIVRVEVPRRLTFFDSALGLEGSIRDIERFSRTVVAATGSGLYRHDAVAGRFVEIEGIPISWIAKPHDDALLVGTEAGLFRVDKDFRAERIISSEVYAIANSSEGVLLGTPNGISILEDEPSVFTKIPGIEYDVRGIFQCRDLDIIAVTRSNGVVRILSDNGFSHHENVGFSRDQPRGRPSLVVINNQPAIRAQDGVYRLDGGGCDDRSSSFVRDTTFFRPSNSSTLLSAFQDHGGNVWTVDDDTVAVVSSSLSRVVVPDLSFEKEQLSLIEVDPDSIVWMSAGDQLLRYDPRIRLSSRAEFRPIIEEVSNIGSGEILASGQIQPINKYMGTPIFGSDDNDLLIQYSAPLYTNREHLRYSFFLDGRSERWSGWSSSNAPTFTNLHEGAYTFRVKARNEFGNETPEATFSFVILPPWYRTVWAYISYLLAIGVLAFLSTKYYQLAVANRKAKEQALELARERVVNEKLKEANNQLHVVNERLTEVNALKDEFLATTSHELRTPITAIQGYAAILKEELVGPHSEFAGIIDSSSQRLMQTLNAVLDLAKLRSGAVDLYPVVTHVQDFAQEVVESFRDKALAKGIAVSTIFCSEDLYVFVDQYSLRNIISNVLDNAIKFSDAGTVSVSVSRRNSEAVLKITDEGIGVDPEFLPFIFDEFRQESNSLSREQNGSGLGLAIASRMVDLVQGSINIESQKDVGTTVSISFSLALDSKTTSVDHGDREPVARKSSPGPTDPSRLNA